MIYLGLDVGLRTVGVAISHSGVIASALTTIRYQPHQLDVTVDKIANLANSNQVTTIIIGLPKHMNNDIGVLANYALKFGEMLKNKVDLEIIYYDERLSTKSALQALSDSNIKREKQKALKDEVAAQIILQNYLNGLK